MMKIAKLIGFLTVMLMMVWSGPVWGAISAEEAAQLGTTLTGVGAEKAGNREGTIPAYTGGLTSPPKEFKPNSGVRPDPFAYEKPLFSIDARNMEQYADKLTEGAKALMKKYPTFRIDVYPTHRSVAFPDWVIAGTKKAATRAKVTDDGLVLTDAHGGIPFPIPKSGYEAMWNSRKNYRGNLMIETESWYVDSSGRPVFIDRGIVQINLSWHWDPQFEGQNDCPSGIVKWVATAPPRKAGLAFLSVYPLNWVKHNTQIWFYLPGQRRLMLLPEYSYDMPNAAGISNWDDIDMFNGAMDRFEFKLIGKKEMYVPYNCYKATYGVDEKDLLGPRHLNPDHIRWELHRVWVVEGRLKEGKRHNYSLRRYYQDEDSWNKLAADNYDLAGSLYRVGFSYQTQSYDLPGPTCNFHGFYDLKTGMYHVANWPTKRGTLKYMEKPDPKEFTPEALAGGGVR